MMRSPATIGLAGLLAWQMVFASHVEAEPTTTLEFSSAERAIIRRLGPWPATLPPDAGNELSGNVEAESLGEQLFRDTRLSGDGRFSCATCHQPARAFSDGLPVALGVARHTRNTQSLLNLGLQRWFGWDGGADSLWAASLRPVLSDIEMDADITTLANRFRGDTAVRQALSSADIGYDLASMSDESLLVLLAKSIGAYIRTLQSPRTPFDAFRHALEREDEHAQSSYPLSAQRGLKTFIGSGRCFVCHNGPLFSNGEFHDIGRPFFTGVGQVDPGRYAGIQRVRADRFNLLSQYNRTARAFESQKTASVTRAQVNFGQWRTPSLRNLKLTAPYMHDGSLQTLREVVDYYSDIDITRLHANGETILRPLGLSESAREDLVQFLLSLSP